MTLTSLATMANPLPLSPMRAALGYAFNAKSVRLAGNFFCLLDDSANVLYFGEKIFNLLFDLIEHIWGNGCPAELFALFIHSRLHQLRKVYT